MQIDRTIGLETGRFDLGPRAPDAARHAIRRRLDHGPVTLDRRSAATLGVRVTRVV